MTIPVLLSIAASLVYTATIPWDPFPGRWAVKAACAILLAVAARRLPVLAAGLVFGAVGDALLDLSPGMFVAGLVAFLCGHVAYLVHFNRAARAPLNPRWTLALLVYAVTFTAWLWPGLGAMRVPVALYVGAITAMAASSARISWTVAGAAVLFLVSDSLLAANRFRTPVPLRDWLVWITYYLAQLGIAVGSMRRPTGVRARAAVPRVD